jgi:phosphatidylserine/phosphatidylglycerophosphate/cardiolipin synthase-like enzyme
MRNPIAYSLLALVSVAALACTDADLNQNVDAIGQKHDDIEAGSPEEAAVLGLVNDPAIGFTILDDDVGLDRRAAENIIVHRDGADSAVGTADDDLFDSIDELDGISYVGPSALDKLLAYAVAHGYMPGTEAPSEEELVYATLALANDRAVGFTELDDTVGLDRRAAENMVAWRSGVDGVDGTPDDRTFMTIADLDDISYVGDSALGLLRDYAVENGYLELVPTGTADVIFSPQPYYQSHNARVVELIEAATTSLDIAMYSFSDNGIYSALEDAVARGVTVRFIFDTASEDRKESGSALESTRSARLEKMGIDVRWVNKIMHHKLAIIDGPRTDLSTASTATLVTGSGNWSHGAATRYDENTLFLTGYEELTLRMQREFNHMWDHSRDFVYDASLPYIGSVAVEESDIPDDPATDAHFTSDNFSVSSDTFRIVTGRNTVSDAMVAAIENATDSIWVASGHLRSRPISEALMAKAAAHPEMDIRVYADSQEYISSWYHGQQLADLDDCLADATTASQERYCYDKGFLFGYQLGESGIDVRYKYYAFRWHYTYAEQMHHKLMIIDGDELWTGSYNQSDNAEHNTFENMLVFKGLPFGKLIGAYRANFETLWDTHRDDGTYDALLDSVANDNPIPLVFEPMALEHAEVDALKDLIVDNCPDVYSDPFRNAPESHTVCYR